MTSTQTTPLGDLAEMLNDASIDRVMAIDTNWEVIAWNKTSEKISGIKKETIMGKKLTEIFPHLKEDANMMDAIETALHGHSSFVASKAGAFNRNYYENHFIPLMDEEGKIFGVMNLMHDVSHRIKAEKELERLNADLKEKYHQLETANAELATFTSLTGSDLKEPIQKLYTALEYVIKHDSKNLSDTGKGNLRRMQGAINRINLLLDDVMKLAAVSNFSQSFTAVDLNEVLADVLASMREKIRQKSAEIVSDKLPTVKGSRQMINYLFQNLITNSIKFQDGNAFPNIRISGEDFCEKDGSNRTFSCIVFSDNGIGFEQADEERIFRLFEKLHGDRKFAGSGVGLTICRKIMETHGGYIKAEGMLGEGATFKCFFPHEDVLF